MADLEDYLKALGRNDIHTCLQIEEKYGLSGFPPEVVSEGLAAAKAGKNVSEAIINYTRIGRTDL